MARSTTWLMVGTVAVFALGSRSAYAQDPQPGASAAPAPATPAPAPVVVAAPPPVVAVATVPAQPADETTDHDKVVGRFGVGYLGLSQLPIASGGTGGGSTTVDAPVIGMRYWLNRRMGIDAGLGLHVSGGSTEQKNATTSVSVDKPGRFGMAIHGGLPLSFAQGKHYSFQLVPEANFGFANSTIKSATPGTADLELSGWRLDLGARIGAEVHFGFIGVPQLALQGSVGLYFRHDQTKRSQGDDSFTDISNQLGTSVQSDPWALFVNSISALYYF